MGSSCASTCATPTGAALATTLPPSGPAEKHGSSSNPRGGSELDALLSETGEEGPARDRHLDRLPDESEGIEKQIERLELHLLLRETVSELTPEAKWLVRERFFAAR